jgi:hypothetical protein
MGKPSRRKPCPEEQKNKNNRYGDVESPESTLTPLA